MKATQRLERGDKTRLSEKIDEPSFKGSLEKGVSAFLQLSDRLTSCCAHIVISISAQGQR